jgi:hypothetical protein
MKLFVGVMSKNIVDAVIEYANENDVILGLIPSRRQVDYNSGYANEWTTQTLALYVKRRTSKVIIERDHGGQFQGVEGSNYHDSYAKDTRHFQGIHIDPFKTIDLYRDAHDIIEMAAIQTSKDIMYCENVKWLNVWYEVGTEEAIYRMDDADLWTFLHILLKNLPTDVFEKIEYAVVQSGTRLLGNINVGSFDKKRLEAMVGVTNEFGLMSKIHNGDYMPLGDIKNHYEIVDAINIAPEFGYLETLIYLDYIPINQFDKFYQLCYDSGHWEKWVDDKFDPQYNKLELVKICGHYVFSTNTFQGIKKKLNSDIDKIVKKHIKTKIGNIINV